jgi:hypothetical protein
MLVTLSPEHQPRPQLVLTPAPQVIPSRRTVSMAVVTASDACQGVPLVAITGRV